MKVNEKCGIIGKVNKTEVVSCILVAVIIACGLCITGCVASKEVPVGIAASQGAINNIKKVQVDLSSATQAATNATLPPLNVPAGGINSETRQGTYMGNSPNSR